MRTIKSLVPILILLILSYYGYQKYDQLPAAIINGIVFLPIALALLVIGLAVHFNRSPVFFYVLLIIIANVVLGLGWAETILGYALVSAFLPLLLMLLTILPERGIFSVRAIPAYGLLVFSIMFTIVVVMKTPAWATHYLLTDWLPARYFDWTPQSQSVLMVSVIVFISLLVSYFVKPSPHLSAGLGVLVMLIVQMHFGDSSRSLNIFSSIALMMCLYAVMQESWRMAYLDELTELPTRRALREKFQKMSGVYTVAMLDVDHFKKFNDTYGHDTGDAVLRMIAGRLNKVTGGGVSYRYGGEEFTIVFSGKGAEETEPYLNTLRETIASSPFVVNRASRRKSEKKSGRKQRRSVTVTVSIGMADSGAAVSSPWDVLKLADKALYRAKGNGRNCVSS
ncbi:MAG: GGDEF domain-containing protein [Gammaproteobacteria bacterium]|nr:GGDEF domain-containing protein [Gammaproteobacteria bacterium]